MTTSAIAIVIRNDKIHIEFPDEEKSLDKTCWIVAKILNIVAHCFPCLTSGVAEIQFGQKIHYVYRSDLARTLQCDSQASCSNLQELQMLVLGYFKKNERSANGLPYSSLFPTPTHTPSSTQHQELDIHQMAQQSNADTRKKVNLFKEEQAAKQDEQIARIRARVAHLAPNDQGRLATERFIETMKGTRKSMLANLDEIATASGIPTS